MQSCSALVEGQELRKAARRPLLAFHGQEFQLGVSFWRRRI